MKLYIFESLEKVSNNWHEGGGLVIIAKDRDHAEKLCNKEIVIDWDDLTTEYDIKAEPRVYVFPNAGCC